MSDETVKYNSEHPIVWARNRLGQIVHAHNFGWQPAGDHGPSLIIPSHSYEGHDPTDSAKSVATEFKSNCRYGIEYMHLDDSPADIRTKLGSSQVGVPEDTTADPTASETTGQNRPEGEAEPAQEKQYDPRDLNKDDHVSKEEKQIYRDKKNK